MAKSLLILLVSCLSVSVSPASEITILRTRSESATSKEANTSKASKALKSSKGIKTNARSSKPGKR